MKDNQFDACMERIKNGDKEALKEIYIAYSAYIFHLLLGILQNRENAEDLTSEFFIKLWKLADTYRPGNGHRAYMSRIAHNMAIDYLRAHKREVLYENEENYDSEQNVMINKEALVEESVIGEMQMEEALQLLNPSQREVVHLKIVGQFTFEEISELLQCPMGTVAWRYREAIKKLRRCGFGA